MHLLLLTGIGVYSFVWIAALYRSLAARPVLIGGETVLLRVLYRSLAAGPVLIGGETVLLRVGFLWRAEFRRDRIRSVRRFSAADEMRRWSFAALRAAEGGYADRRSG